MDTISGPFPVCAGDPFPDLCREFNVTMSATNALGIIDYMQNFTSNGCQGS